MRSWVTSALLKRNGRQSVGTYLRIGRTAVARAVLGPFTPAPRSWGQFTSGLAYPLIGGPPLVVLSKVALLGTLVCTLWLPGHPPQQVNTIKNHASPEGHEPQRSEELGRKGHPRQPKPQQLQQHHNYPVSTKTPSLWGLAVWDEKHQRCLAAYRLVPVLGSYGVLAPRASGPMPPAQAVILLKLLSRQSSQVSAHCDNMHSLHS